MQIPPRPDTVQRSEILDVSIGQGSPGQNIGPHAQGRLQTLLPPPLGDAAVMPRRQDFGHPQTLVLLGPGVVRVFEEARAEALLVGTLVLAHEVGDEPAHGLDEAQGAGFAAVQHEVAHGHGLDGAEFLQTGVEAFVPPAQQGQFLLPGQLAGQGLGQGAALGAHHENARPGP